MRDPPPARGGGGSIVRTAAPDVAADVELDVDATSFVHSLVHQGFPHHTVLAWTDVRPQLRTAADLLGIPVVEW